MDRLTFLLNQLLNKKKSKEHSNGFLYFLCTKNQKPPCGKFELDENARGIDEGLAGCCICKWRFNAEFDTIKKPIITVGPDDDLYGGTYF